MAEEPINATQRILRQIQETLADHGRRFDRIDEQLGEIATRMRDVRNGMIAALGLATNADVRHEAVRQELDDLRRRVEALEEKI